MSFLLDSPTLTRDSVDSDDHIVIGVLAQRVRRLNGEVIWLRVRVLMKPTLLQR